LKNEIHDGWWGCLRKTREELLIRRFRFDSLATHPLWSCWVLHRKRVALLAHRASTLARDLTRPRLELHNSRSDHRVEIDAGEADDEAGE
jgi:hypothetical protein